jgi:hypothetical protein
VVVTATETKPKKVRVDLKAWATRCLKEKIDPGRKNWWAERGRIRHLDCEEAVETAARYVLDAQDQVREPTRAIRSFQ